MFIDRASSRPFWRPPFISAMILEGRSHLNGPTTDGDLAAYVSAASRVVDAAFAAAL